MFDKNYKNAMDRITVDSQTCDKILDRIILKEELKARKNPAIPWRIAFACVACVAIVLGVVFVPRDNLKINLGTSESSPAKLKVSKSYDEIYKLIKPKKQFNLFDGIAVDDAEAYVEDYEIVVESETFNDTNGTAMPGNTSSGNTVTKGDTTNDETKNDFSTTTEQVEGVAEADIVKTDGEYIYYLKGTSFSIFKADGENTALLSKIELSKEYGADYGDMFLKDDRVIIMQTDVFSQDGNFVLIKIYDVSDPKTPKEIATTRQEGSYKSSRMVGDYIYLISECYIDVQNIDKDDPATFVPTTETNGVCEPVPADSIYRYDEESYTNQYTVICAFNYNDGARSDTASLLGGTDNIYCSGGNIILADTSYSKKDAESRDDADETVISKNATIVSRLAIEKGKLEYKYSGEVDGILENQFFIDEHNGYFRFVTTVTKSVEKTYNFENTNQEIVSYSNETSAQLTVLDSELKKVGEITDLAKGEKVYSVRFMGDTAYFVTFRQTDPLFSADLSDPTNPKILGELKIPGFSQYMYPYGDGLLLGFGMDADENTGSTKDLKLSMFNISNPADVTEQDKTEILGYRYSPALYNHKAMLVDADKNLIGFAATNDYYIGRYVIFEYTGNGFENCATLIIEGDYKYAMDDVRGLFIGNDFYVISKNALQIFDIDTFSQTGIIEF